MAASNLIKRRELVSALLARREGALVVPGLGSPTWDCFAAGDSAEFLYSWGGMGLAVSTALGLALARPDKRIFALTGDGEMMMGLGSLAVVGAQTPANLGILVLDNEHFGETGRQPGLTGERANLCAMAHGAGIAHTLDVTSLDQMDALAKLMFHQSGPTFATAKIALTDEPWALPEKDGAVIARRFREAVQGYSP
jgi:thiamine pyrophosphate-dependent acetolactate synthase large subunit-like protein